MTLTEPRWDVARAALADVVEALPAVQRPVADCDRLVLARDLLALCALPSFDTSAMDGWAVSGSGPWTVVGASLAGRPVPGPLVAGQAVVIATGGVVPAGSDGVIRSEDGEVRGRDGVEVVLAAAPEGATHVRPAGEECSAGEVLALAGTVLTPALLGLAAAAGHDTLHVVPRPRAALVLFGDELATSGVPEHGRVRDSLGPQVPAWLERLGVDVVAVEFAADTMAAHVEAMRRAAQVSDLVLTTGGTAAGPVDHLHAAIAACDGAVVIDSVAVRPGHPMLAGTLDGGAAWIVGLPGNPQSAIVTLVSLAAPIVSGLAGRGTLAELPVVTCSEQVGAPAHEDRLVLGRVLDGVFQPGSHLGSGMLRGLAGATGFAVLPPGGVAAGAQVRWLALPT
jgi:molybdopterin molybdotransferase